MKKKFSYALITMLLLLSLAACQTTQSGASSSALPAAGKATVGSVAIVSFAVNNYGALFGQGAIDSNLIEKSMGDLLTSTEEILGRRWTVKPADSFVGTDAYYNLSTGSTREGLFSPVVAGKSMPTFVSERNDVVKGNLETETAQKLCQVLGVDAVVLYYSEWTLDSGKFIPTIKALTKNCVSMYDKNGKKLFYKRVDKRGDQVIGGAFAGVHINEETIGNWIQASVDSLSEIFSSVKI
jgi:hypothetical protein